MPESHDRYNNLVTNIEQAKRQDAINTERSESGVGILRFDAQLAKFVDRLVGTNEQQAREKLRFFMSRQEAKARSLNEQYDQLVQRVTEVKNALESYCENQPLQAQANSLRYRELRGDLESAAYTLHKFQIEKLGVSVEEGKEEVA